MGIYYVRVPSMGLRKIYMVLRYRLVHCEVTGYSEGTAYDPKFSLKILFQYKIISEIAYLGGQGDIIMVICPSFRVIVPDPMRKGLIFNL